MSAHNKAILDAAANPRSSHFYLQCLIMNRVASFSPFSSQLAVKAAAFPE